jgi:hypothetical protein
MTDAQWLMMQMNQNFFYCATQSYQELINSGTRFWLDDFDMMFLGK